MTKRKPGQRGSFQVRKRPITPDEFQTIREFRDEIYGAEKEIALLLQHKAEMDFKMRQFCLNIASEVDNHELALATGKSKSWAYNLQKESRLREQD